MTDDNTIDNDKKRAEEELKHSEEKAHNYAVAGKGEEVGMMARGHDANEVNGGRSKAGADKKKDKEFFDLMLKTLAEWQSETLGKWKGFKDEVQGQRSALQELYDAFKKGERKFDTPEYADALLRAGLTSDDVPNFTEAKFEANLTKLDRVIDAADGSIGLLENTPEENLKNLKDSGQMSDAAMAGLAGLAEIDFTTPADDVLASFDDMDFGDSEAAFDDMDFGDSVIETTIDPGFSPKEDFTIAANPSTTGTTIDVSIDKAPVVNTEFAP